MQSDKLAMVVFLLDLSIIDVLETIGLKPVLAFTVVNRAILKMPVENYNGIEVSKVLPILRTSMMMFRMVFLNKDDSLDTFLNDDDNKDKHFKR